MILRWPAEGRPTFAAILCPAQKQVKEDAARRGPADHPARFGSSLQRRVPAPNLGTGTAMAPPCWSTITGEHDLPVQLRRKDRAYGHQLFGFISEG
jgi:hypothetical protein